MREKRASSRAILPSAAALVVATAVAGAFLPQPSTSATGGLMVEAPVTGTAGHFRGFGGWGVRALSGNRPAVAANSFNSWGGHFTSAHGYGIRVDTGGTDHWDHAGFFTAVEGYGLLAESSENMAIRGHSGEIGETSPGAGDALWQPVGNVGVVGLGASRGVYGSSRSSYGSYSTSLNWYGAYGRTSRMDNNYGLYTPDNFFAANISSAGSMTQIVQNAGAVPLTPGDVAIFVGLGEPFGPNETRHVQVARADTVSAGAVAGVVQARYNTDLMLLEEPDPESLAALRAEEFSSRGSEPEEPWVTRAEPVPSGEFLLMVTHGPAEVRASTVAGGSIRASDLLVSEPGTALAARATGPGGSDDESTSSRIVGTALTPLAPGDESVWAFVRPR